MTIRTNKLEVLACVICPIPIPMMYMKHLSFTVPTTLTLLPPLF